MKAVLIGADLMYRQDGKLVPIEINTNTAWDATNRLESSFDDIFDFDAFKAFLDKHNIEEIWVDGLVAATLVKFCSEHKLNIKEKTEEELAEAEDRDGLLLLRTSYSDEALVDAFCRDKSIFLEAIKGLEAGCEYILKKSGTSWKGEIKNLPDNGDYPNLIVKYRYPYYDRKVYPKLVKVSSQEELRALLESDEVPENYLVMPFYFNEKNLYKQEGEERLKLLRHFSMFALVDGALEAVPVGTYTKLCGNLEGVKCTYSELGVLDAPVRSAFLNYWVQLQNEDILAEAGDLVLMSDDTWKPVEELAIGDLVKSLDVPSKDADIKKHTEDYNVSFEELEANSSFSNNRVTRIVQQETVTNVVTFRFTDGTDWRDTANSSYPTIDSKDGTVWFRTLDMLSVGDKIILLKADNLGNPVFVEKEIVEVEKKREVVKGFGLTVAGSHLFITKSPGESEAYVAIEHNVSGCTDTGGYLCSCNEQAIGACDCSDYTWATSQAGNLPSNTYKYCNKAYKVSDNFTYNDCHPWIVTNLNCPPVEFRVTVNMHGTTSSGIIIQTAIRDTLESGWLWKPSFTSAGMSSGQTKYMAYNNFWTCKNQGDGLGRHFYIDVTATTLLQYMQYGKITLYYKYYTGGSCQVVQTEQSSVIVNGNATLDEQVANYFAGTSKVEVPYEAYPTGIMLEGSQNPLS